jgi:hypothetical protein
VAGSEVLHRGRNVADFPQLGQSVELTDEEHPVTDGKGVCGAGMNRGSSSRMSTRATRGSVASRSSGRRMRSRSVSVSPRGSHSATAGACSLARMMASR